MTLTEFLLARIAEDEAVARGATAEETGSGRTWFDGWSDTHPVGMHIGRWTPSRVLAECEAKRQIVERHFDMNAEHNAAEVKMMTEAGLAVGPDDLYSAVCSECAAHAAEPYPCATLRLLAIPYADHPDFREEWRA